MLTVHIGTARDADAPAAQAFDNLPTCLLNAAQAALPVFLEALVGCLTAQNGPSTGYQPGDRKRC